MEYHVGDSAEINSVFEPIAEGDEGRCRLLWRSVLLQQILEAKGKFGTGLIQAQARIWLEGREGLRSGLYEVCAYAGLDFEKTRKRCVELLKDDAPAVDFRMNKRDKEENQTVSNGRRYHRRTEKNEKLRRASQQVEDFLSPEAANDNFPEYHNDNLTENSDDDVTKSTKGEWNE